MGLENRTTGYTVKMSDDQLAQAVDRAADRVSARQVDTLPLGGFDSSAGAMAQADPPRAR
jgi:hypothetical protein